MFYGRFQPFHIGHKKVYNHLMSKFGKGNVYIGTSNKSEPGRSPLSFTWKQKIIRANGIPASRVIQTKQPYKAQEIIDHFKLDVDNSVLIVVVGNKDASRLSGKYYLPYSTGSKLRPVKDNAYYYVVDEESSTVKIKGKVVSATVIRDILSKDEDEFEKKDYDFLNSALGISRAMVDNIKPLFEEYYRKSENIILEGGMGGHMTHIFEDPDLTFNELEQIINDSLSGELNREEIREKTDGQNLFASIIDGKLKLSRNKSQTKNKGAGAMDISAIKSKWKDVPSVQEAFIEAFNSLEKALNQFSAKDLEEIFDNGGNWVNMEIMWPASKNVIHYDTPRVVFHGLEMVDDSGKKIGINKSLEKRLYTLIDGITQGETLVQKPPFLKIPANSDFSKRAKYFVSKLNAFRSKFNIPKGGTVGDWFEKLWAKEISTIENKLKTKLDSNVKSKIVNRLLTGDKSYTIPNMKKDIGNIVLFNEIKKLLDDSDSIYKKEREPLELLFLELGVEVLQNIQVVLNANPDESLSKLRKDIATQISKVRNSKNPEDIEKMRESLRKIQAIGGMNKLVPTEGIIFTWGGNSYKLTGAFAPVNQLMGIGRFNR